MQLAVPTILSSLVMVIYNLADTYFVGMMNNLCAECRGDAGGACTPGLQCGQQSVRRGKLQHDEPGIGRRDYGVGPAQQRVRVYCVLFSAFFFLFCARFGLNPLLILLGADANTMDATAGYLKWTVLFGAAPAILNVVMAYMSELKVHPFMPASEP